MQCSDQTLRQLHLEYHRFLLTCETWTPLTSPSPATMANELRMCRTFWLQVPPTKCLMQTKSSRWQVGTWPSVCDRYVRRYSSLLSSSTENAISLVSGHVSAAQNLYSANNAAIGEAFKAVGTLMASDATKKLTSDVLNVAKKVIGALDAVQGVHPFIGGALETQVAR